MCGPKNPHINLIKLRRLFMAATNPVILTPEQYLLADKVSIINPFAEVTILRSESGHLIDAQAVYLEPNYFPDYVTTNNPDLIDDNTSAS